MARRRQPSELCGVRYASMWILQNAETETTYRLRSGAVKTVGRAPRADFVVHAALVSRLHCRLTAGEAARPAVAAQLAIAIVIFASSVTLLSLQPTGPGAEGTFLGVLVFARLLPGRIALPLVAAAFVALEVIVGFTGQGLAGLVLLLQPRKLVTHAV